MLWFIFHKPQDIGVLFKQESRHFFWNIRNGISLHRISKNPYRRHIGGKNLGKIIHLRAATAQ
jgi:hypothetical protein